MQRTVCFKTEKYAARSLHKQKIVKIHTNYIWAPRSAAVLNARPTFGHYICVCQFPSLLLLFIFYIINTKFRAGFWRPIFGEFSGHVERI